MYFEVAMKKSIGLWQLMGFATTSLVGTILHFLFDLTNNAIWIAPFSGVSESTWEHMKLLFWPMFAFAILQSFFFKDVKCFWSIKLKGVLIGLALIPVIFYTYNGVIGKSPDWINITIFFTSAAIAYIYETKQFKNKTVCKSSMLPILTLCIIAFMFILFTFKTPEINIFKDPITGNYGIEK